MAFRECIFPGCASPLFLRFSNPWEGFDDEPICYGHLLEYLSNPGLGMSALKSAIRAVKTSLPSVPAEPPEIQETPAEIEEAIIEPQDSEDWEDDGMFE